MISSYVVVDKSGLFIYQNIVIVQKYGTFRLEKAQTFETSRVFGNIFLKVFWGSLIHDFCTIETEPTMRKELVRRRKTLLPLKTTSFFIGGFPIEIKSEIWYLKNLLLS